MKILIVKEGPNAPTFVEAEALLHNTAKIDDLAHLSSKLDSISTQEEIVRLRAYFDAQIEELKATIGPIQISAQPQVEQVQKEGLLYYDIINHRLRICTNKGWETV